MVSQDRGSTFDKNVLWRDVQQIRSVGTDKYLEGQGDVVSRLISTITHIITPIIPTIDLLFKTPLTPQP